MKARGGHLFGLMQIPKNTKFKWFKWQKTCYTLSITCSINSRGCSPLATTSLVAHRRTFKIQWLWYVTKEPIDTWSMWAHEDQTIFDQKAHKQISCLQVHRNLKGPGGPSLTKNTPSFVYPLSVLRGKEWKQSSYTMRTNVLNWCYFVSIIKNVVFYVFLVVRIY